MIKNKYKKLNIDVKADTSVYALINEKKDTDENVGVLYEAIREYMTSIPSEGKTVDNSEKAAREFLPCFKGLDHEELWMLLLNKNCKVLHKERITSGSIDGVLIDNKAIIKKALIKNATGIIIAHNHPGGNPKPSGSDIKLTDQLHKACDYMGLDLVDHIILTEREYYSFTEEETIYFGDITNNT